MQEMRVGTRRTFGQRLLLRLKVFLWLVAMVSVSILLFALFFRQEANRVFSFLGFFPFYEQERQLILAQLRKGVFDKGSIEDLQFYCADNDLHFGDLYEDARKFADEKGYALDAFTATPTFQDGNDVFVLVRQDGSVKVVYFNYFGLTHDQYRRWRLVFTDGSRCSDEQSVRFTETFRG
jgi:hypothetical protein